jgi:hypothetical protein
MLIKKHSLMAALLAFLLGFSSTSALALDRRCSELFKLSANSISFQEKTEKVISHDEIYAGVYGENLDRALERYVRLLENYLASGNSTESIIETLQTLRSMDLVNEHYESALRHIDLLTGVRGIFSQLSRADRQRIRELLERAAAENSTWAPTLHAFLMLEAPKHALKLIDRWLWEKTDLISDLQWTGENINGSLILSLQKLPEDIREQALKELRESLMAVDFWILSTTMDHAEQIKTKEPSRSWQLLQQILVRDQMLSVISQLEKSRKLGQTDFSSLENLLLKIRRHGSPYRFDKVLEVARALQKTLSGTLDSSGDYIQIYGSFSNLSAKIGTSDIDVLFSSRLDKIYFSIKGGSFDDGTFVNSRSQTIEAQNLSKALLGAENTLRAVLGTSQGPGDILSVYTLPRTYSHGAAFIESELPEVLKVMTLGSPVSIVITKNKIILRLYDSLSNPAPTPAPFYSYSM